MKKVFENIFEGGEEEKNEAGPVTDRPPPGDGNDEGLADAPKAETELASIPKPADDSVANDANQSVDQPLTGSRKKAPEPEWNGSQVPPVAASGPGNTVTKAKSKRPTRKANPAAMKKAQPSCFESFVGMIDSVKAMYNSLMKWLGWFSSGGASTTTGGLGNLWAAEPEYKPSASERMFLKAK